MPDNADKGALKFPCLYPLKVMGPNTNEFYAVVSEIVEKHLISGDEAVYRQKTSSGGKYLSITATFLVMDMEQLNHVYQELKTHELVLMTL